MTRFADWFDRHRRLVMVILILAQLAGLAGAVQLGVDVNIRNLFRADDARMATLEAIDRAFGTDDDDCLVIIEGDAPYSAAALRAVRTLVDGARDLESVRLVIAPAHTPGRPAITDAVLTDDDARRAFVDGLAAHPVIGERLVSERGTRYLVALRLDRALDEIEVLRDPAMPIRTLVREVDGVDGATVTLSGLPVIRSDLLSAIQRDQVRFLLISGAVGAFICFVLFRRIVAVVVVTCAAATGALWTMGLMGWLGEAINPVNSVVPSLVLIVGFTDAVHLLHEIRERLNDGATPRAAARGAIIAVGPACFLTSLTTAIGFVSHSAARLDVIERFGFTAATGAVMSFVAVMTIVPLLGGMRFGHLAAPASRHRLGVRRAMERIAPFVVHHPRRLVLLGILVTAGAFMLARTVRPNAWLREGMPSDSASAHAVEVIDDHFGGVLTLMALIEWDDPLTERDDAVLGALRETTAALRAHDDVGAPLSVLSFLDAIPGPMATRWTLLEQIPGAERERFVRPDLRQAVVIAPVPDRGSDAQQPLLDALTAEFAALSARTPGVTVTLSGNPVAIGMSADAMIDDLFLSLRLAMFVILIVMTIAFRSLRIGLISVLPNVFPLLCAAAWLGATKEPLTVTGVITFCICLGVAVDDTIHVLHRYRQALHGEDGGAPERHVDGLAHDDVRRQAAGSSIVTVGAALVTTTLVLVGGLGALLFSALPMMNLFGSLACVALSAALVGDLVVLPALLALIGPKPKAAPVSPSSSRDASHD